MKWRARWSHVTIALALIAAVAIAAPAIGGPSLKTLVKKEVAKQIGKATGPAGPPGPAGPAGANGTNGTDGRDGTNGVDGTARAYARVSPACTGGPPSPCTVTRAKGVASATRVATGVYCIDAPGIPFNTATAASVDWYDTADPEGNASAMVVAVGSFVGLCVGHGDFIVATERQPIVSVRNAADNGSVNVAGNATAANDVAFTIVIP